MSEFIPKSRHKGVVLGLEHFNSVGENTVLQDLLADPAYSSRITGLWLPKNILDHDDQALMYSQVANGARVQYQGKIAPNNTATEHIFPNFRLFYDTSSSGGIDDTLEHIHTVMDLYPAQHMTFTVTPSALAEVVQSIGVFSEVFDEGQRHANNNGREPDNKILRKVDFLLATAYPENDPVNLEKFTKMSASAYTQHVSELAKEYGLAGVVGSADLARHTIVGQYYLALGVCVNGAHGYVVRPRHTNSRYELYKRLTSPERTYKHATNTEAHVGRTLFDRGSNDFVFPGDAKNNDYDEVLRVVKGNLRKLFARLDALPEPEPIQEIIIG